MRYSAEKVKQGRDLANKLWNASRLILLRVDDVPAEPRPETVEDRWIVSRLERATAAVTARLDGFLMSRAALDLYDFFWNEVCDWYLELVKPRLYDEERRPRGAVGDAAARARADAGAAAPDHAVRDRGGLGAHAGRARPAGRRTSGRRCDDDLIDQEAEAVVDRVKQAVTALRRYRDDVGAPAGARIPARLEAEGYEDTAEHVARLARFEFTPDGGDDGAPARRRRPRRRRAGAGQRRHRPRGGGAARRRSSARSSRARSSAPRASWPTRSSSSKAPAQVVEAEREKLARYRAELERLERRS